MPGLCEEGFTVHGTAEIERIGAQDGKIGTRAQDVELLLQIVREPEVVAVEQGEVPATSAGERGIPCGGDTAVALMYQVNPGVTCDVAFGNLGRLISGPIV